MSTSQRPSSVTERISGARKTLWLAGRRFAAIDGTQRAAAFSYYAFFSLFPLLVLLVSIGSLFYKRDFATQNVIGFVKTYVPLDSTMEHHVTDTVAGVLKARGRVGIVASVVLIWASLHVFRALLRATMRAWQSEMRSWWQLPLKTLVVFGAIGSALVFGLALHLAARFGQRELAPPDSSWFWLFAAVRWTVPLVVLFCGFALFFRLAPRHPTRFREVLVPAAGVTVVLRAMEFLFVWYVRSSGKLSALYGTFAGIMALLLWIYVSGCVIIYGTCAIAVSSEQRRSTRT